MITAFREVGEMLGLLFSLILFFAMLVVSIIATLALLLIKLASWIIFLIIRAAAGLSSKVSFLIMRRHHSRYVLLIAVPICLLVGFTAIVCLPALVGLAADYILAYATSLGEERPFSEVWGSFSAANIGLAPYIASFSNSLPQDPIITPLITGLLRFADSVASTVRTILSGYILTYISAFLAALASPILTPYIAYKGIKMSFYRIASTSSSRDDKERDAPSYIS